MAKVPAVFENPKKGPEFSEEVETNMTQSEEEKNDLIIPKEKETNEVLSEEAEGYAMLPEDSSWLRVTFNFDYEFLNPDGQFDFELLAKYVEE